VEAAGDHFGANRRKSMPEHIERRKRRSEDPIVALHYQLSTVRRGAEFEAVVLVDDAGCLVAGAGAWPVCQELAAYAPFLAHRQETRSGAVATRATEIARDAHVRSMEIDGTEVLLCALGGGSAEATSWIVRAAAGCRRILRAEC